MSGNTTSSHDENTKGMKVARWIAWFAIAACSVFFVVYTAMFH